MGHFPEIKNRQQLQGSTNFGLLICLLTLLLAAVLLIWEIRTSWIQAELFSRIDRHFSYHLGPGASKAIRFPDYGPYDRRLGYVRIPEWIGRMREKGFEVAEQARWSPPMIKANKLGIFPIYREKNQAGIRIEDWWDRPILVARFPQRIYPSFDSIPPLLVKMLLFIENRHLLSTSSPYQNPAVAWKRLSKAILDELVHVVNKNQKVVGGSTLATQIEKFRHSPGGITRNAKEKFRQMISASLRSYQYGIWTIETRRQIVKDYIDSIPLAAAPGFGAVNGIGDGLWAWYNMNFKSVNRLLEAAGRQDLTPEQLNKAARAVKAALSLFIAQRWPSGYLLMNRTGLEEKTDDYLKLMAADGIIPPSLRDAALKVSLHFARKAAFSYFISPAEQKAANFVRYRVLSDLGVKNLYDLDRLDLTVKTSIDMHLQREITRMLYRLKNPDVVSRLGLKVPYLLDRGNPSKVVYSFSLYEQTPHGNMLRVQTNNYKGSFNVDSQMELDLGSTAKLRTLVNYLQIITALHNRYAGMTGTALARLPERKTGDPLTRWAIRYLINAPDRRLSTMLSAAMDRRYSASPARYFFTGGGWQKFANFDRAENHEILTVRDAFCNSVNLVFIRLMRDIVYYYTFQRYGITGRSLKTLKKSEKEHLLSLFADKEGKILITRYYARYHRKSPLEMENLFLSKILPVPARLAAVFRYLNPDASQVAFIAVLHDHLSKSRTKELLLHKLYRDDDPRRFTISDIGNIAHIHPLELWVVKYLRGHPDASLSQAIGASTGVRQEVYHWLFKTKSRWAQLQRIRTVLEMEAFQDIYRAWKKAGYPFDHLVPSYATAIGCSADRPSALAELIGIIQNNGVRRPMVLIRTLHFAEHTPYETLLVRKSVTGKRIITPEAAETLRSALMDVAENGTARRLHGGVRLSGGRFVNIGGKTGTGDHWYKTFGPGDRLVSSVDISRSATFVFFIGNRFFGTMTAYVLGRQAADYGFTSALSVQVLKLILPDIKSLLEIKEQTIARKDGG